MSRSIREQVNALCINNWEIIHGSCYDSCPLGESRSLSSRLQFDLTCNVIEFHSINFHYLLYTLTDPIVNPYFFPLNYLVQLPVPSSFYLVNKDPFEHFVHSSRFFI